MRIPSPASNLPEALYSSSYYFTPARRPEATGHITASSEQKTAPKPDTRPSIRPRARSLQYDKRIPYASGTRWWCEIGRKQGSALSERERERASAASRERLLRLLHRDGLRRAFLLPWAGRTGPGRRGKKVTGTWPLPSMGTRWVARELGKGRATRAPVTNVVSPDST
jgi:hypothetical protein